MFSICSAIITRLNSIFHKTANQQWRQHVGCTRLNQPEHSPMIPWFDMEMYTSWGHPFELLSTRHTGEHGGRFLDQNTRVEWRLQCPWLANIKTLCPQHGQKRGVWSDDYDVATPSKEFHSFGDLWFWQARWCQMISQQSGASATHFKHSHLCAHVLVEYLDIIWATWEGIN